MKYIFVHVQMKYAILTNLVDSLIQKNVFAAKIFFLHLKI